VNLSCDGGAMEPQISLVFSVMLYNYNLSVERVLSYVSVVINYEGNNECI